MDMLKEKKHFILVHGACHGAWSWFKLKPLLEAEGHKVNAVDLSGAGINTTKMEEVNSLYEYSLPLIDLLESIPSEEKVILVGHSFGGFSVALAADKYPDKVSVAVFAAAFMPDSQHFPSYIYQKMKEEYSDGAEHMRVISYGSGDQPRILTSFAPSFLASHLYQLCSPEGVFRNSTKMEMLKEKKHFILVHGACHGAWSWFKLKPLLEAEGHKVNAVDLSGAGINTTKTEEINSLYEYSLPLMDLLESIDSEEKVILVGHSFGGFSVALAADKYPDKVSVAVFAAAFMPDSHHFPSYILIKMIEEYPDAAEQMQVIPYGNGDKPQFLAIFTPNYLASHLYQLCSSEDLELATMLVRPYAGESLMKDMSGAYKFSKEGYGSVKKVYIVSKQDKILTEDFQRWLIENDGNVTDVMEMKDADHMLMLSDPQKLSQLLLKIALKYSY